MLVRAKVLLTLFLIPRSYEKVKMVMEDGDFPESCIKSEADFCLEYYKFRLFSESYF